MTLQTNKNRKRIIVIFFLVSFLFCVLIFRVGWIQIVAGEKYTTMAIETQTRDIPITAKRGIIYDRNKKELAISASTNRIWVNPNNIDKKKIDESATTLAAILGLEKEEVKEKLGKTKVNLVQIAKYVEKSQADAVRAAGIKGIAIDEVPKRYYPFGNFAAYILGSTTDDNNGLSGVELKYNKYLTGTNGRWIRSADVVGRQLAYGTEKYFQAENGLNAVLTIDETIQHFMEKALREALVETNAKRVMALAMDPKTGNILAMASVPDFDPNHPRVPLDPKVAASLEGMDNDQKQDLWNKMWRNPLVSDTYEPGSTFKLLTTAIALEENVTNATDTFNCTGTYEVAGITLKCWRYPRNHGHQTLVEGVANSCNPVFIQLGQRVGTDKFFKYLKEFGILDKTGVDFPGEAFPQIQARSVVGPVELATMSYGQGIAVTPIQLLSAICSIGNEGKLMKPKLVSEFLDDNGNIVEKYDPVEVRQIISKKTATDMLHIMEGAVANGSGKLAAVPGYRIGGKTGTADKAVNGKYGSGVCASFVGIAPIDDPQIALLLVVDEPQGVHFGSQTAAPPAGRILAETLRYLNIKPTQPTVTEDSPAEKMLDMPNVAGMNYYEAGEILEEMGLLQKVMPEPARTDDFKIIDQYPKAGEKIKAGNTVYIYSE